MKPADIELHDATIDSASIQFAKRTVSLLVAYYPDAVKSSKRVAATITFSGVERMGDITDFLQLADNRTAGNVRVHVASRCGSRQSWSARFGVHAVKETQLNRGLARRLMYIEAKSGLIGGANARIGWVTFSRSGRSVRYADLVLTRIKGGGIAGNYYDQASGEEFWVSGVKARGSNRHPAESGGKVVVDPDAVEAFNALRRKDSD